MPIYCGNNLNAQQLTSGTHTLGTKYECLRKGIGVGSHLPYDENFSGAYMPVDNRKYYCGKAEEIPAGYDEMGSPSICIVKGVGIGKAQRARMGPPVMMYFVRYILPYMLFAVVCLAIFVSIYMTKPDFVSKKDEHEKIKIDWTKFAPYYVGFCLLTGIIIYFIWNTVVLRYY
jgi:hypothetical protein